MNKEGLDPCPFCAEERYLTVCGVLTGKNLWVVCDTCNAEGPVGNSPEEAKYLWNQRPSITTKEVPNNEQP